MDRFAELSAFVAVCEANGFAAGGRRLGLSPSAVTRLIGALEARLDVRLLNRTTRSLSLTDAGRRYLERARRVLAELDEAEAGARRERVTPSGRLIVSAPRMFGRLHVAPLLSRLMRRYPALLVELQLNDRFVNLVEEGIDLAVRIGDLGESSLVARRVGETRRVVVGASSYVRARGRPERPEDLAKHAITLFTTLDAPSEWRFNRSGDLVRVVIEPAFVTNSAEAAIDHVLDGGGLARVLAYQVAAAVRAGTLEIVLADFEFPPVPISVVYPSSRLLSAKVRAFVDLAAGETGWRFVDLTREASSVGRQP